MSRRKKRDDFTTTWSSEQAKRQREDQEKLLAAQIAGAGTFRYSRKFTINPNAIVASAFGHQPNSQFSGSEFAMGTAVGVRSWDVDRLGRLQSPHYKMTWAPGEVIAECRTDAAVNFILWGDGGSAAKAIERSESHAQAECTCGFYAYYEGFNEYANPDRITGVIEGYGETQIGTRGFRSAKARIVALHVPEQSTADAKHIGPTRFERVRRNYGEHVEIFDDYSLMVERFPTTQPESELTPKTDPEFWTRSL